MNRPAEQQPVPVPAAMTEAEQRLNGGVLHIGNQVELGDAFELLAVALGRYHKRLVKEGFAVVQADQYTWEMQATARQYLFQHGNNMLWITKVFPVPPQPKADA